MKGKHGDSGSNERDTKDQPEKLLMSENFGKTELPEAVGLPLDLRTLSDQLGAIYLSVFFFFQARSGLCHYTQWFVAFSRSRIQVFISLI